LENLTHTDTNGKAHMIDVAHKPQQNRRAVAEGEILLNKQTISLINDNMMKKGDVLTIAEIAGIQAAKRTADLIPLCHTLIITKIDLKALITDTGAKVSCEVKCIGQTGVEMEALTGVSIALLTIYDMCKAVDKNMTITNIHLIEKTKTDIPHN